MKKAILIVITICMMLSLTACGQKCKNGCGNAADPNCMAGMCDKCCTYWMGLNGCYRSH